MTRTMKPKISHVSDDNDSTPNTFKPMRRGSSRMLLNSPRKPKNNGMLTQCSFGMKRRIMVVYAA